MLAASAMAHDDAYRLRQIADAHPLINRVIAVIPAAHSSDAGVLMEMAEFIFAANADEELDAAIRLELVVAMSAIPSEHISELSFEMRTIGFAEFINNIPNPDLLARINRLGVLYP